MKTKTMKKILLSLVFLAITSSAALAGGKMHMGIHTGFDLGAAVPWPLSKAVGGGDKMNATPKLTPALGFSGEYEFLPRWSAVVEATYKTVALDASIVTLSNGQNFKSDGIDVIFYGKAKTSMSFTMLEVPLYVKFKINENNRVFLGGYYSYIVNGKFEATAIDGRLHNRENPERPPSVISPEHPLENNFSENMDNWDVGFQVGYERKIWKRVSLAGRFSTGFKDIFKPNQNYLAYSMWNMRGAVTLSYRLF